MAREVSGKDWHWFYDRTASRPPYLLAVEEPQLPSIETIVEEVAGMLSSYGPLTRPSMILAGRSALGTQIASSWAACPGSGSPADFTLALAFIERLAALVPPQQ